MNDGLSGSTPWKEQFETIIDTDVLMNTNPTPLSFKNLKVALILEDISNNRCLVYSYLVKLSRRLIVAPLLPITLTLFSSLIVDLWI